LKDVTRPVPLDPFSGRPYRYELIGTEFRIYSLGVNRAEDGRDATKDIVWWMKRRLGEPPRHERLPPPAAPMRAVP